MLIALGDVRLRGRRQPKAAVVHSGDLVDLCIPDELLARAHPVDAPPLPRRLGDVEMVHQDDHLTVLLKPAGRSTHPLDPEEESTVANHLAWADPRCLEVGGPAREGGLCHRLDRLTSGLLLAARTPEAYQALRRSFRAHRVEKGYLALVGGSPPTHGEVNEPIESLPSRRRVRVGSGQPALSSYRVRRRYPGAALVEVTTRTGRRHQVRAHMASVGHPLVEDLLYGGGSLTGWGGEPLLHAHRLCLPHPCDDHEVSFSADLPVTMEEALRRLDRPS